MGEEGRGLCRHLKLKNSMLCPETDFVHKFVNTQKSLNMIVVPPHYCDERHQKDITLIIKNIAKSRDGRAERSNSAIRGSEHISDF